MKCTRCGATLSRPGEMCDECGSLVQVNLSEQLPEGTMIAGKYRIADQIGSGGMGRVYRATQDSLGNTVCIKTLHTGATADPQFAARFEREARTTSKLRHPHIVTVFDFGTHMDGSMYLVMEYVEGVPLSRIAGKSRIMSASRAVKILGQVCDALTLAHSHGVIHRDLKPANIMVADLPGQPDFVKVLDFGSALMLDAGEEAERLTRVGSVIGTPAYMAPEYLLGRGVDARIDVYAVGTLLYTMLTGSPPFRGDAQSVFAQQVSVPPELPSKRNPNADVSTPMEQVIMRSLIKDPAKRYGSAADLKAAMEGALAGVGDDTVDLEQHALGVGVEVAHHERSVVVLSLCATGEVPEQDLNRIYSSAQSHGAEMQQGMSTLLMIFGLDRDIPEAAAEAMKCGMQLANMQSSVGLKVGIRDAQASCKGRHGTPGFSYELFGDGADTAEHLAAHVQPSHTMISGPVSRHVPPELRLTPVLPPPNLDEPAFVLTDPLRVAGALGQLPFVGRKDEQRTLLELAVGAKEGKVCVLEAPAGMGKTRLVREIVPQAARVNVLWAVIPASPLLEIGPAHPVSLVAAVGWSSPGGSASTTERYAVDLMLGRRDMIADGLSGERRQLRLVSAALDGVARRLEHGPMVVVLDELQDADDLTWSLARRIVDMAPVLKVGVLLCVRDAQEIPFSVPDETIRLTLPSLTPREIEYLAETSEMADLPAETVELLTRFSEGVPQLAEEIFRMASSGNLMGVRELEGKSVEDSVKHLVRLRIDSVSDAARQVLDAAAVLGPQPVEKEALAMLDTTPESHGGLAELRAASLMSRSPAGRLHFAFPRIREVTLEVMPRSSQVDLHVRAARLIESSGTAPLRVGEVAEHILSAGGHGRAFRELREAADLSRAQGATRRAIRYLRLALKAGDQMGDSHAPGVADAARVLGQMLIESGDLEDAETILRDAFPPAKAKGAHEQAADLLRLHGTVLLLKGDEDGTGEVQAALGYAEKMEFSTVAAQAYGDLAQAADSRGSPDEAVVLLKNGLDLIEAREDPEAGKVRIQLYNRLGRLQLKASNITGAIAYFTQALSLADRLQDRYQGAGLLGNLGGAYARKGEMDRALHFTERALRASEGLGDQIGVARQSYNLALIRLAGGNSSAAKQLLRSSYDAARRSGWREGLAMSTAALAKLGDSAQT